MSETVTVTWRFRLGQWVRWMGDQQMWLIRERCVIESTPGRLIVEYYLTRPGQEPAWMVEVDLQPLTAGGGITVSEARTSQPRPHQPCLIRLQICQDSGDIGCPGWPEQPEHGWEPCVWVAVEVEACSCGWHAYWGGSFAAHLAEAAPGGPADVGEEGER